MTDTSQYMDSLVIKAKMELCMSRQQKAAQKLKHERQVIDGRQSLLKKGRAEKTADEAYFRKQEFEIDAQEEGYSKNIEKVDTAREKLQEVERLYRISTERVLDDEERAVLEKTFAGLESILEELDGSRGLDS
jgi:hypothetical protein